jgi:hypothetical protein
VVAVILSSMGEGPRIGPAVIGSPLSVIGTPLVIPVAWTLLGGLIGTGHRKAAVASLILHLAAIPVAITVNLKCETWAKEWSVVFHDVRESPVLAGGLWSVFFVGYGVAWWFTIKSTE